ncbi:MAG: formimidoylglutamase [Bdellovibrionales bacterium]
MSFSSINLETLYKPKNHDDIRLTSSWENWIPNSLEEVTQKTYHIGGYPCDLGIEKNGGRPGAKLAPATIRSILSRMTPPAVLQNYDIKIFDHGDMDSSLELQEQQFKIIEEVKDVLDMGGQWIGIGGGHDYGYPDGAGFIEHCLDKDPDRKPIIINFDAHLDVRSDEQGITSGTPFYKLLKKYPNQFDFVEIGIQSHCNSRTHYEFVKDHGGTVIWLEETLYCSTNFHEHVLSILAPLLIKTRPAYLSVDIDVFSNSYAMGCSQSWSTGLSPDLFFPVFKTIIERLDVRTLGIYEVSPPLDLDNITSKLASQIIYNFIYETL